MNICVTASYLLCYKITTTNFSQSYTKEFDRAILEAESENSFLQSYHSLSYNKTTGALKVRYFAYVTMSYS